MTKKKKSPPRARKGKAKAKSAGKKPAQKYPGKMSGMKLSIKMPKVTAAKKRPTKKPAAAKGDLMSRIDFLKTAMSCVATIGTAAVIGEMARAQPPPPPYTDEEMSQTLAAMIDTLVPGIEDVPVPILVIDQQTGGPKPGPPIIMTNLGAPGETTPGAAFLPQYGGQPLAPCYLYFYTVAQQFTGEPGINQIMASILDGFSMNIFSKPFRELIYGERFQIFYLMDNPDLLIAQGVPAELAIMAKELLKVVLIGGSYIYYSELCNLVPSGVDPTGMPTYGRQNVGGEWIWIVIPDSAWHQMDYPGPIVGERNYDSPYTGLDVRIVNGEVVFEG